MRTTTVRNIGREEKKIREERERGGNRYEKNVPGSKTKTENTNENREDETYKQENNIRALPNILLLTLNTTLDFTPRGCL